MSNIKVILPDLHLPWTSWERLKEVSDQVKSLKKQRSNNVEIIQLGDLIDGMAWSRYPKGADSPNAQAEWDQTELAVDKMKNLFPDMRIIGGNHDIRLAKKAVEAQLPKQFIKSFDEIFQVPGWKWHISTKPLVIDGITYIHGDEYPIAVSNIGLAASRIGGSVVFGHTHQAAIAWVNIMNKRYFAFNVACIIDEEAICFSYAAKNPRRCMQGYGLIVDGVPHFLPL
jgi:UDP-2,3-diacylglucosamine pyrophosphatase LpxH